MSNRVRNRDISCRVSKANLNIDVESRRNADKHSTVSSDQDSAPILSAITTSAGSCVEMSRIERRPLAWSEDIPFRLSRMYMDLLG